MDEEWLKRGREALTVFDELLDAVSDEEISFWAHVHDIARLEPTVFGECLFVKFRLIPIPMENVRTFYQ